MVRSADEPWNLVTTAFNSVTLGGSAADIEGDGDLDLLIIKMNGPNELWINDGQGVFSLSSNSLHDEFGYRPANSTADPKDVFFEIDTLENSKCLRFQ